MTAWSYRIPSDIGVTVQSRRKPSLLAHFLGEEAPDQDEASLILDLGSRRDEQPRALLSIDPASRALTVRGVYKAIPWSCRLSRGTQGAWVLGFRSPILREYLALHIALIPSLRRLLLERGIALVPGAAFESDGAMTLLAGPTGGGKTAVLLGALEKGARLIGDEYLGLSGGAEVMPVARVLALRRSTLSLAPRTLRRLGWRRRLSLRILEVVALLTRSRFQPLIHVTPADLGILSASDTNARARRLFWLESEAGAGPAVRCEPMSVREAAERLAIMQAAHDLWYGDLGAFLDLPRQDRATPDYGSRWRHTVEHGLAGASCYRLTFPADGPASPEVLEQVLRSG